MCRADWIHAHGRDSKDGAGIQEEQSECLSASRGRKAALGGTCDRISLFLIAFLRREGFEEKDKELLLLL